MSEDWQRPTRSPLRELPPAQPPRAIPGWIWTLGAFTLGALLMAGALGIAGVRGLGSGAADDRQAAAYERGLAAGAQQVRTELDEAVARAEHAAYRQGWRAGALAANPARASAFEISPLLHFKVPLEQVSASWLAECPTAVPTLTLVLAGFSHCYTPVP